MNIIPENLKKYQKFISLVLKYRNSDILSAASDKALDELAEDQELSEESNRYTSPEELVEDEMVRRVYLGQNFELRKKKLEF